MNEQKVAIPANLLQAIVSYLAKRPFEEVAGMISAVQQVTQEGQLREVPPPAN